MGEGDYRVFFLMSLLVVALFCSWGFGLPGGALSSLRGFGLVAGAENSYGERWPPATFFLMSLLVVALFCSRALDL